MRKMNGPAAGLLALLMVPLLLFSLKAPVQAQPAKTETGSLTVTLTDAADGRSKEGVTIAVIQAGTFENGKKILNKEFEETGIDLNALTDPEESEEAAAILEAKARDLDLIESSAGFHAKTNASGTAVIRDLPAGIYLVYAADIAGFERIIPALVSIPSADKTGLAVWDVQIEPKHTALPVLLINKIDAADKKLILNRSFVFSGYSDSSCSDKVIEVRGNSKSGTASFVLTYGILYIKESQAPEGYSLSGQTVKAEYRPDNTLWINGVQKIPDENGCVYFDYLNTKKRTVSSGSDTAYQSGQPLLYLMAAALAVTGASVLILQKKRNR